MNGESDEGGFDEFRLFCLTCRRKLRNLGLKLLNPLSLPHHQSSELLIGRTAISRHPTMVNKMPARSTSHAGDLTSHDSAIVRELVRDARLTNRELANQLGIAPSTCLVRTRLLRQRGVITGFHAEVDLRQGTALTAAGTRRRKVASGGAQTHAARSDSAGAAGLL